MSKILIIDDEEQLRRLMARIIGLEGYEVAEAPDCASGMKTLRRYDPDEVAELPRQQAQDLASLALADAANSSGPLDPRSDDFYSYAKGYDMDIQLRVVIDRETSTTVPLNVPAFALRMQKFIDGLEFQVDGTYDSSTVAVDEILYN